MEEKKVFDILSKNREQEEEMLSKMSKEEQDNYMKQKSNRGQEIAKKFGLKIGE